MDRVLMCLRHDEIEKITICGEAVLQLVSEHFPGLFFCSEHAAGADPCACRERNLIVVTKLLDCAKESVCSTLGIDVVLSELRPSDITERSS